MNTIRLMLAALSAVAATPAGAACSVADKDTDVGTQSPAAIRTGMTPYLAADGGFSCTSASLVNLLADNFLRATLAGNAVLTLTSPAGGSIAITLAGMPDGSVPLRPGIAANYVGGDGTTILSLGGGGAIAAKVYVKPSSATLPATGTYVGTVDIKWDWRFCSGAYALGACVGDLTQGSATARVKITLSIAPKPASVQVVTETTWDTVSGTQSPKALPGSRQRVSVTVTNTDIVVLDLNTLAIVLPTMAKTAVALDGDGRSTGPLVTAAQGTPASGLTLAYTNPADQGDDVDFSSDNGASWTFAPSIATQGSITRVRFRPKGSMAAGSSFTMSIPYSVK